MMKAHTEKTTAAGIILVLASTAAIPAPAFAAEPPGGPGGKTAAGGPKVHSKTVLSKVYDVDRKYKSMTGPSSRQDVTLGDAETPELLWITGYQAVMVGEDGEAPMAQEFMCHSNLDVDTEAHRDAVGSTHGFNPRLFTLSQGQFDVKFPPGFGIPVLSTESLALTTQVLNHNLEGEEFKVRHKVSLDYVRDAEAGEMSPLFPVGAYGLALLEGEDGYFGVSSPDEEDHGPGCLPGTNASSHVYRDPLGRQFTGHWVVGPGREVNRTLVTKLMQIPYDTTAHYIAVHLHPFAESLELRDLTADKSLFKSAVENFEGRIGLERVDYFSSVEGIELFKDHEYEIVSVYDNTTDEEQDSMAVMYLYLRDKVFDKDRVKLEMPEKSVSRSGTAVLPPGPRGGAAIEKVDGSR